MAYVGVTNQVGTGTSGGALYVLKETLKLAGWTAESSGTGTGGTTGAGDLVTSGSGTDPGSFSNANAWVCMREPSPGTREYILQNGSADNSASAIIKYSRATGFTSGGTATVAPTTGGGDGIVFHGTGTDAAPVQATWLPSTSAGGYYHAVASDTPVNGVWGWWWYGYTTNPIANFRLLGTEAVAPGSTPANDADPSVRYKSLSTGDLANVTLTTGWWEAYGLVGQTYRTTGNLQRYVGPTGGVLSSTFPGSFSGLDPYTGLVFMYPGLFAVSTVRPKGFSTEVVGFGTTHNALDTFNLSSESPKITLSGTGAQGGSATPWVPNVVPLS